MLSAEAKIDAKASPLVSNSTPSPAGPERLYLHWCYS
jgi:hypothetical protein